MADDPEAADLAGPSQERRDAQRAAAATAREIPQGGGTSTSLASKAAGLGDGPQSQALRIAANPSLLGPSPMFVRPEQASPLSMVAKHQPDRSHGRLLILGQLQWSQASAWYHSHQGWY